MEARPNETITDSEHVNTLCLLSVRHGDPLLRYRSLFFPLSDAEPKFGETAHWKENEEDWSDDESDTLTQLLPAVSRLGCDTRHNHFQLHRIDYWRWVNALNSGACSSQIKDAGTVSTSCTNVEIEGEEHTRKRTEPFSTCWTSAPTLESHINMPLEPVCGSLCLRSLLKITESKDAFNYQAPLACQEEEEPYRGVRAQVCFLGSLRDLASRVFSLLVREGVDLMGFSAREDTSDGEVDVSSDELDF